MNGATFLALGMVVIALITARYYYVMCRIERRQNMRLRAHLRRLTNEYSEATVLLALDRQLRPARVIEKEFKERP